VHDEDRNDDGFGYGLDRRFPGVCTARVFDRALLALWVPQLRWAIQLGSMNLLCRHFPKAMCEGKAETIGAGKENARYRRTANELRISSLRCLRGCLAHKTHGAPDRSQSFVRHTDC
jgi:hypothetical protein